MFFGGERAASDAGQVEADVDEQQVADFERGSAGEGRHR
jgi:hypothetical protein